jgi:hypothetical protein
MPDLDLIKQVEQGGAAPARRFARGRSGNPAGRQVGCRDCRRNSRLQGAGPPQTSVRSRSGGGFAILRAIPVRPSSELTDARALNETSLTMSVCYIIPGLMAEAGRAAAWARATSICDRLPPEGLRWSAPVGE